MKLPIVVIFSIFFSAFQVMALDCEFRCSLGNFQISKKSNDSELQRTTNSEMPCHSGSNSKHSNEESAEGTESSGCGNLCSFSLIEHSPKIELNLKKAASSHLKDLVLKDDMGFKAMQIRDGSELVFYKSVSPPGLQRPLFSLFEKYII